MKTKKGSLTRSEVEYIAKITSDAYSYTRYGRKNWIQSIVLLDQEGYSPLEIEWILRSKLMRWAGDSFGKYNKKFKKEVLHGDCIIKYIFNAEKNGRVHITEEELSENYLKLKDFKNFCQQNQSSFDSSPQKR